MTGSSFTEGADINPSFHGVEKNNMTSFTTVFGDIIIWLLIYNDTFICSYEEKDRIHHQKNNIDEFDLRIHQKHVCQSDTPPQMNSHSYTQSGIPQIYLYV